MYNPNLIVMNTSSLVNYTGDMRGGPGVARRLPNITPADNVKSIKSFKTITMRESSKYLIGTLTILSLLFLLSYERLLHIKDLESIIISQTNRATLNNLATYTNESDLADLAIKRPFNDIFWCEVYCKVGVPCKYHDEVDFRIIVLTFNRSESLLKCLNHINELETLGDKVSVEIWFDRFHDTWGINHDSMGIAKRFQRAYNASGKGRVCIHKHKQPVYIDGQWTDTWRPKPGTRELGLILEDDVDISPLAYKWLKVVHGHYGHRKDIMGYTLQTQNIEFLQGDLGEMKGPKEDNVFMYGLLGTWGFSPHPEAWRQYQNWVHVAKRHKSFKPYVEGIKPTERFKAFEKWDNPASMWEMWHMYFTHINKLYCVYPNLGEYTGRRDTLLSYNRMEPGIHVHTELGMPETTNLLKTWDISYERFPQWTIQYHYNGAIAQKV